MVIRFTLTLLSSCFLPALVKAADGLDGAKETMDRFEAIASE